MKFPLYGIAFLLTTGRFSLAARGAQPEVTFNRNIAPIIYKNCSPCHRPGESGPFSLLSYEDVKRHASQIADVTKRRFMPPWLPEAGYGEFEDERRLTTKEIALIGQWVQQGAKLGSTAHAPAPPKFSSEWQLGPPDMILHVAHPYEVPADGNEIFWNFILPVPIKTERWVRAIEVRPGNARVFHHANVIIDRSGAARRQEKIAGIGFPGMDLTVEETTFDPDGHFLSWKPGSRPVVEPDGMAWRATPGMDLILNVHLRPTGKPEVVNPEIGIYFTDKPQTKYPMLVQLEDDRAIDIKPGVHDFLISDDFRCPEDLNVLAIYPHAHYLAKLMEGYATLPDGSRKWLIRIPNWDLGWQGVFILKKPLFLAEGHSGLHAIPLRQFRRQCAKPQSSRLRRLKPACDPRTKWGISGCKCCRWAKATGAKFCRQPLYEDRLKKYPDDFAANYNMGDILLTKGDAAGAISYFEKAARVNPTNVLGPMELGVAYYTESKLPEAEQQFRNALLIDPKFTDARFNLASTEAEAGDLKSSVSDFRQVLTERPDYPKAQDHLGDVLFAWGDELAKSGDNEQAAQRYREALTYRPNDVALHTSLGAAFARLGQMNDARTELETAVRLNPNFEPAQRLLGAIGR